MKLPSAIVLIILGLTSLSSCKKDNDNNDVITYPDFSQLKVGNYWVYQQFRIDSSGNETVMNVFDSCFVEKDTLINGNVYFKMFRESIIPNASYSFVRDSLHYIVDNNGKILFSSQDFNTVFEARYIETSNNDTVALVYKKMADKDLMFATPAGIYITSNCQETYDMYPNWNFAGDPRRINVRYAENVGVVSEILPFYSSNPNYTERRLVRFHLN